MTKTIKTIFLIFILCNIGFVATAQSIRKANKLFDIHSYNKALYAYKKVLTKQPDNIEALSKLGKIAFYHNRLNDAKVYYKKVIQYGNLSPDDLKTYGQVLMELGEYKSAQKWFDTYKEAYLLEGAQFSKSCEIANYRKDKKGDFKISKEFVNSSNDDIFPSFYKESVVFMSTKTKRGDVNWKKGDNSLWVSGLDHKLFLTKSISLGSKLNKYNNVGPLSYSADGRFVAYTKNNFKEGLKHTVPGTEMSIFIAEVLPNGTWKNDKAFPYNSNSYSVGFPSFSKDGNTLFFSSNRPDGLGGYDIYASQKINGIWQHPENLGTPINTPGNEITPFHDGASLFFSSDWHFGFGGMDVFRIVGNVNAWGKLYSLGWGINSSNDDYGFIFDGNRNIGYLASNRKGGNGKTDLYRVLADNKPIEFAVKDDNGKPLKNVLIDLGPCSKSVGKTDSNGKYNVNLSGAPSCNIVFSKIGYETVTTSLPPSGGSIQIILKEISQSFAQGIVKDARGIGLSKAQVMAVNKKSGEMQVVSTDLGGNYSFPITYDKYEITVKKDGFTSRTISFSPSKNNRNTLKLAGIVLESDKLAGEVKSSTGASTTNVGKQGYAVQLAAIPKNSIVNMRKYGKLASINEIYIVEQGKFKKVRLGPFLNKANALAAQKKVKKKGFDSFIVKDTYFPKVTSVQPVISTPTIQPPTTSNSGGIYYIRLAAYKSLKWFDPSKISNIGQIETEQKGEWKIKYIGSFSTIQNAQANLPAVKAAGYKNAYIVKKVGHYFEKIN